jgi:hypothetical protein
MGLEDWDGAVWSRLMAQDRACEQGNETQSCTKRKMYE